MQKSVRFLACVAVLALTRHPQHSLTKPVAIPIPPPIGSLLFIAVYRLMAANGLISPQQLSLS